MRPRSPIVTAASAVLLLALAGLAYWGYASYKKRVLEGEVLTLVRDADARARAALEEREPVTASLERLDGHFQALAAAAQRLSGLETWRSPMLVDAAQQYVDEVHALVRRQIAVQRGREAVRADVAALGGHIRAARARSSDWIRQAIELRQRMDRDFFDFRLAEGGLRKSFQTLGDARANLAPLVAPLPLVDDRPLADGRTWLSGVSADLESEVEAARKLPLPR